MTHKNRKKRRNPGRFITQNRLPKEKPSLKEIVKGQKDNDVIVQDTTYWAWMEKHGQQTEDGDILESAYANPDVLANVEVVPVESPTQSQQEYNNVREAMNKALTNKEKYIMMLLIDGFSQEEIARNLAIKQQAVNHLLNTARIKLEKYLQEKGL